MNSQIILFLHNQFYGLQRIVVTNENPVTINQYEIILILHATDVVF